EAAAAGRRGPRRPVLALLGAVLVILVGTGVWYINSGQFSTVPAVLDLTRAQAEHKLAEAGLKTKARQDFSDVVERGHVIGTDPKPGGRVRGNGTVTLTVSRGPEHTKVPNVAGIPLDQAKKQIKDAGLTVGTVRQEFSDETAQGSVLTTEPGPGSERRPDSAVALTVSKGKKLDVPEVTGDSVEDAAKELTEKGFKVKIADERVFSEEDKGDVARQSPAKDAPAAKGDTITLTVSKGQEMVEVPDVTGDKVDDAKKKLSDLGFEVEVKKPFFFPKDTVDKQSVHGGDEAPKGSKITITLKGL
ncbi:serine/threonine protein kinase, partial [Streptomyces varsoviensis]